MTRVGPEGPMNARLVCIGESLGPEEERLGRPFIGRSGEVLEKGITYGNLQRGQVLLTNLCKYKPPNMEDPDKTRWLLARRNEDIAELQEEMKKYSPTTICLIGKHAVHSFLGICGSEQADGSESSIYNKRLTPGIFEYHGSTFTRTEALALQVWAKEHDIKTVQGIPESVKSVVVSLHPAFALRGHIPRFVMSIQSVICTATRFSQKNGSPPRPPLSHFNLYASADHFADLFREHGLRTVTIDVETLRDNFRRIIIFGAGTATSRVLVGSWNSECARVLQTRFSSPGETAGHNILFDLRSFAAFGVRPTRIHKIFDTIVAAARLQPVDDEVRDYPWLSLAACSARYDPGFWYWKETERSCQRALFKATWPAVPFGYDENDFYERLYNGIDVFRTSNLQTCILPRLQREGM